MIFADYGFRTILMACYGQPGRKIAAGRPVAAKSEENLPAETVIFARNGSRDYFFPRCRANRGARCRRGP